jgi:small subunit ribosomal protein S21
MLEINVKEEGSIEKALKTLKKKFANTKVLKQLRDRKEFVKPSELRRAELKDAKYKNNFINRTQND